MTRMSTGEVFVDTLATQGVPHAFALRQAVVLKVRVTLEPGDPLRRDTGKKPKRLLDKYAALGVD